MPEGRRYRFRGGRLITFRRYVRLLRVIRRSGEAAASSFTTPDLRSAFRRSIPERALSRTNPPNALMKRGFKGGKTERVGPSAHIENA